MHDALRLKGFAVVFDSQANRVVGFLDIHFHPAGFCMTGDIGQRFLGNAVEHSSRGIVQLFDPAGSKGRETNVDTRPSRKTFHKRMEGGNQSQVVQHHRAQVPGEPMHDIHRLLNHPLRAGDLFLEAFGIDRGFRFQGRQPHIDTRQGLGNLIMQLMADLLAFFLLRHQELAGQKPQLFLHVPRLLQQIDVVLLAVPERFLQVVALDDFLCQLPVRIGQSRATPA